MSIFKNILRTYCSKPNNVSSVNCSYKFETVFSLPSVKYFAIFNRLKVYHAAATAAILPGCGVLEVLGSAPDGAFLMASYIGFTAGGLLSFASLPFKNIIGYIYISSDNKNIKISSVDFWGKRKDKIISVDEWTPLLEMPPKNTDALYLSPQLTDGTKYKLFVKFGKISNSVKMAQTLE